MAFHISPSKIVGSGVPEVKVKKSTDASTFKIGALLLAPNGSDEVAECAADPASIYGVALQAAASSPGEDTNNSPTVITGPRRQVSIARANALTEFQAPFYNGATATTPTAADVTAYGVTKLASGIWVVDKAKTGGSARVDVQSYDADRKIVFFKFKAANIA
jgi:hypothetical protein